MMRVRISAVFRASCSGVFLALLFGPASMVRADLIITGVVDGPLAGGLPKAVEVFALADIPNLGMFGLGSANNGGGTDGQEFTFPAITASAGDVFYIASESPGFSLFFGFAPNFVSSAANINGDDAIELFKNGTVIDVFGDINVDGSGEPWEYTDGWAYRVNGTGPDGTTFVLGNWFFSGPDALDDASINASASAPFPLGSFQQRGSEVPEPGSLLLWVMGLPLLVIARRSLANSRHTAQSTSN